MRNRPSGYEWAVRDKEVVLSHHGREAVVLRGEEARQFVRDTQKADEQLLIARIIARRGA